MAATAPGSGTPMGTVTFKDGAMTLGASTLTAGTATFTTSALSVASHSITAAYGGSGSFNASTSSALAQTVNTAATATVVGSSQNPSVFGQIVTLTATITAVLPGAGIPSGSVTFKDGSTTLGTGTLSSGVTTLAISSLAVASHSITAIYGGSSNFAGSTSSTLTQTVNQASTTTVLASSWNPSATGSTVTFTATVSAAAPGTGTPTGDVTFKDNGVPLGSGTLNAGVASFGTSSLAIGTHPISAVYGGAASFAGSTSNVVSQSVTSQVVHVQAAAAHSPVWGLVACSLYR